MYSLDEMPLFCLGHLCVVDTKHHPGTFHVMEKDWLRRPEGVLSLRWYSKDITRIMNILTMRYPPTHTPVSRDLWTAPKALIENFIGTTLSTGIQYSFQLEILFDRIFPDKLSNNSYRFEFTVKAKATYIIVLTYRRHWSFENFMINSKASIVYYTALTLFSIETCSKFNRSFREIWHKSSKLSAKDPKTICNASNY